MDLFILKCVCVYIYIYIYIYIWSTFLDYSSDKNVNGNLFTKNPIMLTYIIQVRIGFSHCFIFEVKFLQQFQRGKTSSPSKGVS